MGKPHTGLVRRRKGSTLTGVPTKRAITNESPIANGAVSPVREYSNLREWAYRRVREMIITGELPPGADIHEGRLCAQLGISKSPLREALRQLAQDGLVIATSNRGSHVSVLTEEDIVEIYALRRTIEEMAVRLAAGRINPEQVAVLEANVAAMERRKREGDVREFAELDVTFHVEIARIAGHRRLLRVEESLQTEFLRLFIQQIAAWGDEAEMDAVRHHRAIVAALAAHDADAAVAHLRSHILSGERYRNAARNDTHPEH